MKAGRRTLQGGLAVLFGLASSGWSAESSLRLTPVPKELLPRPRLLRSAAENFSIEAPDDGWEWLQLTKAPSSDTGPTYVCLQEGTDTRLTVVVRRAHPGETSEPTEEFLRGWGIGIARASDLVGRPFVSASDLPLPSSIYYSYRLKQPTGTYVHGYTHISGRVYSFVIHSKGAAEPEILRRFVKSFRLLSAPRAASPAPSAKPEPTGTGGQDWSASLGMVHFLLLACIWGFGRFVNVVLGRPAINGALVALATILLVTVVAALRAGFAQPSHSTEVMGFRLGEALIPLGIAAWGAARFSKKKQALTPPS